MTKIIAAAVVMGLITVSAMGHSFARVNVPFAFFVGDAELPAGAYQIETVNANAMRIINTDDRNKVAGFIPVGVTRNAPSPNRTAFVFTRYGNDYYLSQIWAAGALTGRALLKSSQEAELARRVQPARIEEITASRP